MIHLVWRGGIRTQSPPKTTTPPGLPPKQIELQTQKERL